MVDTGLMSGYASNGWFGAYDNITLGQAAVILYRAEYAKDPGLVGEFGSTTDPAKYATVCAFKDMRARDYYTAAVNNGVIGGVNNGDGTFSMDPTGKTWRSAVAKMFTVVMRDFQ